MKLIRNILAPAALTFLLIAPAVAQETQVTVIDEGVVQVNEVVITLSRINREINNAIDSLVREKKMTREEAKKEIEAKKGRVIASLIEEELIMQKGKELGMENDVEARVNQQFIQQKDQLGFKSLDELFAAMRSEGIDPDDIRAALRSQITRQWVFQSQVDEQVGWSITEEEIKNYFEQHKDEFIKPATVTLSEIFLSFAGADPAAVRQKAKDIVAKLRAGGDFKKLAVENSDRPNVAETKGLVGTFEADRLADEFRDPVAKTKAGQVTDPVELTQGVEILRVDAKTDKGTEGNFDEEKVKLAMLKERVPPARKKYLETLREEAYIKIADSYRPLVTPFLNDGSAEDEITASK